MPYANAPAPSSSFSPNPAPLPPDEDIRPARSLRCWMNRCSLCLYVVARVQQQKYNQYLGAVYVYVRFNITAKLNFSDLSFS